MKLNLNTNDIEIEVRKENIGYNLILLNILVKISPNDILKFIFDNNIAEITSAQNIFDELK